MQTPIEFAMTFLLNAVWQVALIAFAAAVCTKLLRGVSARYKYVLWVAALILALLLPVMTSVWYSMPEAIEPQYTRVSSGEMLVAETFDLPATKPVVPEARTSNFFSVPTVLAIAIFAAYVLFVLYRGADLFRSWIRTRAVVRGAHHAELPESIVAALERCRSVIGERDTEILFSHRVPVPVTIGNRHPVVILPEHFLQETDPDVLTTALGHEMVHVERRDYAYNLLFEITLLPLSFHPAAAYAKRQVAHMRELCCDEIVATRLLKAEAYARSLLNIAGSAPALNLSPIITVGITDADLEVRIMSLLKRSELSIRKKAFLISAAAVLLAIPLVAAAFISPSVAVNSGDSHPAAQPTPPEKADSDEQIRARREELEIELAAIKIRQQRPDLTEEERAKLGERAKMIREKLEALTVGPKEREWIEGLETKLEWLKAAMQDPKLNDVDRAKVKQDIESLERELTERKLLETDSSARTERLKRQLVEVVTALQDPILTEKQRTEYAAMEEQFRRELKGSEDVGYSEEVIREKWERLLEERLEKGKLPKSANISMEQAVEIALASRPGSRLKEKGIGVLGEEVVYTIFVREGTESNGNYSRVVVSGIDGRIIETEPLHVKVTRKQKPQ